MLIDYATMKKLTNIAEIHFSPAFVHGVLTVYAMLEGNDNRWVNAFYDDLSRLTDRQKDGLQTLAKAKEKIKRQLADSQLGFQLLSRSDVDVREQTLLTREWVSGYWLGLKRAQLMEKIEDTASLEFIEDLQRIAAMPLPEGDDQDSLSDLIHVQEYCRMGAISVFLSLSNDT